jgi:hypothetical protein
MDSDALRYGLAVAIAFVLAAIIKQFLWWLDSKVPDLSSEGYFSWSWLRQASARRARRHQGAIENVGKRTTNT